MSDQLSGVTVAILATNGFEEVELTETRKALDAAGATTKIVSLEAGKIRSWKTKDWGDVEVAVDQTVDSAKAASFDALLLPGGVINPDKLRMNKQAVDFVRGFFDAGKPVAAICHGPWSVIEAGAARGRRITSWPSLKTDLKNAGADWVDQEVVVDRGLTTSRNPDDIPAFNREMVKQFSQPGKTRQAA
jgi:protease I